MLELHFIAAVGEAALGMYGPHTVRMRFNTDKILSGQQTLKIMKHKDQIAGYSLTSTYASDLYLLHLFVHPDYNRRGVGSLLLQEITKRAARQSRQTISLLTSQHAAWTVPFYAKHGFNMVAAKAMPLHVQRSLDVTLRNKDIADVPGYFPLVYMRKDLG